MKYLIENLGYPKTVAHVIAEQLQEQSDFIIGYEIMCCLNITTIYKNYCFL